MQQQRGTKRSALDDASKAKKQKTSHEWKTPLPLRRVIETIEKKVRTKKEALELNQDLLRQQIIEFYADSFELKDENRDFVNDCLELYCQAFPKDAGLILNAHIHKKNKFELSQLMLEAGADGTAHANKMFSFEIAVLNHAPNELLQLMINRNCAIITLATIEKFYDDNFEVTPENKEGIKLIIHQVCANNNKDGLGEILNRNIHKTSKDNISQWIIEAGAELGVLKGRLPTFYYATISNLSPRTYELFLEKGWSDPSVKVNGKPTNATMLAAFSGNDNALTVYSQHLKQEFTEAYEYLRRGEGDYHEYCTLANGKSTLTSVQARLKLWMHLSESDRRAFGVDKELMSEAFSSAKSIKECVGFFTTFFKLMNNHIERHYSMFFNNYFSYTKIMSDLFTLTQARICKLVNAIPDAKQRLDAGKEQSQNWIFSSPNHKNFGLSTTHIDELRRITEAAQLEAKKGTECRTQKYIAI